jgi:hypothetical protein
MTETVPALPAEIAATIEGGVSGQVIVGDHNLQLQIGAIHGGVLNLAPRDERPRLTARTAPVLLLPRRFPGLLDRHETVRAVEEAASTGGPVEIHGEAGTGKTVLLRHLAHELRLAVLGDGVVHLNAAGLSAADLLQSLYEAFYETSVPFKPTTTQIRLALQGKRALLLVDGPRFDGGGIEPLLDAAPESVLVVTARERHLLGEGRSIALPGLPAGDALALIERELGRSLTGAERPHAERLCASLGYNPLRILRAAAQLRDEQRGFAALAAADQTALAGETGVERTLAALTAAEREVVELLAAVPGTALDAGHLAALAPGADVDAVVRGLVARRVVEGDPPRYRLAPGLEGAVSQARMPQVRKAMLDYFAGLAESLRDRPERLHADLDAGMSLLESAAQARSWTDVLRLGRALDPALTLALRWNAWERALRRVETAARAIGDRGAESWALHQLGTRALCLDDNDAAGSLLRRALDLRESVGDQAGAAVTGHNLRFLNGLPPIDGPGGDDSDSGDQSGGDAGGNGSGGAVHSNGGASWRLPRWLQQVATVGAGLAVLGAANLIAAHQPADGGGPAVTTTVTRPAGGMVGARPAALTFPDQAVGTTSLVRRVTVRNLGRAPLLVIDVRHDGPELADFEVDGGACMTKLAPGAGCEVTAAFIPRTAGVRSAELVIEVNAGGGPLTVPLTGVAVDPGPGRLNLEPESVPFEEQPVGTTSTPKEVVVRNAGGQPVSLRYFERDGLHPQDFAVDTARCPGQLAPGATCPLAVTLPPTAAGARGASLVAVSDAANDRVTARLAGSGLGGGPGRLRADPSVLSFISPRVGSKSEPRQVTMANVGETPVTIREIRPAGDHAADFTIDASDCQGAKLGTGQRCVISATFTPGGDGVRNAKLVVSSDGAEPETTVLLQGRPSEPVLEIVPEFLDLGEQPVGRPTPPRQLLVRNRSSAPVKVGAVDVLGEHAADFALDSKTCRQVLNPDKSCALKVVFTPGALHDRSARVVVDSDPPGGPAEAALAGVGRQPEKKIEVTPMVVDFDRHPAGTSIAKRVRVDNIGEEPVTLGEPEITADDEANASAFAASSERCPKPTLDPGGSCEIEVTFAPAAPNKLYSATLKVHSDVPEPAPAVELSGTSTPVQVGLIRVTPDPVELDNKGRNSRPVKVESVGEKSVTIGQIVAVPSDRFQIGPDQCSGRSLAPTDSCELTVTFTPPTATTTDPGPEGTEYEAVLKVPSDASSTPASPSPATVKLTGKIVQRPRVLAVDPDDFNFGEQAAGSKSPVQLFEVTSSGTEAVKIDATNRTGGGANAFTVDDRACLKAPLEPNASCQLAVTFTPGTPSTHFEATVEIVADAAGEKTVKLTGDSGTPLPDLVPTKAYKQSTDPPMVTITVANRGIAEAQPTSASLQFSGHALQTRDVVFLPPSTSTNLAVEIPRDCIYGCKLTVTVDERNLVREADEDNNQWTYLIDPIPAQATRRDQVG